MKRPLLCSIVLVMTSCASIGYTLEELQGAWWSSPDEPTADFAIHHGEVWLDFDSRYHPCWIEDGILIFDLGEELGLVRNRIVSLRGNELTLENLETGRIWTVTRALP